MFDCGLLSGSQAKTGHLAPRGLKILRASNRRRKPQHQFKGHTHNRGPSRDLTPRSNPERRPKGGANVVCAVSTALNSGYCRTWSQEAMTKVAWAALNPAFSSSRASLTTKARGTDESSRARTESAEGPKGPLVNNSNSAGIRFNIRLYDYSRHQTSQTGRNF